MNKLEQTTCKRCGRKLKNKTAIALGMGTVCWKKYMSENNHKKHKKLFDDSIRKEN